MASKGDETREKRVEIPAIQLERTVVRIVGVTPLLTNKPSEKSIDAIQAKARGGARNKQVTNDPEEDWRDGIYIRRDDGKPGFPASGIKKALVHAGGRFTPEKMTVLRGVLTIQGDLIAVDGSEPRLQKDIGRNKRGNLIPLYRAMFMPWRMEVPVIYNAEHDQPGAGVKSVPAGWDVRRARLLATREGRASWPVRH